MVLLFSLLAIIEGLAGIAGAAAGSAVSQLSHHLAAVFISAAAAYHWEDKTKC